MTPVEQRREVVDLDLSPDLGAFGGPLGYADDGTHGPDPCTPEDLQSARPTLRRRADAEGITLSELVGRLVAEHLPKLIAELLAERLRGPQEPRAGRLDGSQRTTETPGRLAADARLDAKTPHMTTGPGAIPDLSDDDEERTFVSCPGYPTDV